LLLDAAIVLAIVIIIRVFIASPFQVQGGSMDHTLASNDLILVDQVFDNYQRGDVIVFIPPNHAYAEQEGIWCSLKELKAKVLNENVNEACKVPEFYVKRIIGVPGDKVVIFAGKVYIDEGNTGQQIELYEPYLSSKNKDRTCVNSSGQCSPRSDRQPYEYLVPENSYFVLGDNRTGSNDSRAWSESFVPKDNIRGKVRIVVWPIGDLKVIPGFDLIEESKAHNS
jgi:signal peptidase I